MPEPKLNWETLARTSMHPLQIEILKRIAANPKTSPTELAAEMGEPLGNVSYHVRTLAKLGLLEPAGTAPKRGAIQHFYRMSKRAVK